MTDRNICPGCGLVGYRYGEADHEHVVRCICSDRVSPACSPVEPVSSPYKLTVLTHRRPVAGDWIIYSGTTIYAVGKTESEAMADAARCSSIPVNARIGQVTNIDD